MNGSELDPQQRSQFLHPPAAYGQHLVDRGIHLHFPLAIPARSQLIDPI